MSAAKHEALLRRVVAAFNANDMAGISQLFSHDIVRHDLSRLVSDAAGVGQMTGFLEMLHHAFPDVQLAIEDLFGTDGGRAALRLTISGTHQGELLGVAPTGRRVAFTAVNLYRFAEGRIAETWQMIDWAGALRQIGAPAGGAA